MILDKINEPKDLRKLNEDELNTLAGEMREPIVKKVNVTGGHIAPNLGIIETTIAMHYVFDSPKDKIIFDVSHQCYPHKFLTGRKDGFLNPENYFKYTGYTTPEESEHDVFAVGHTSTSVSLATGVAKARDMKGKKYNVIALIGDGSLTGGQAFEGLNNAATLDSNIIILVNDNDMSIAENQGSICNHLKLLRDTKGKAEHNFFKSLGFDYRFVEHGNDIQEVIKALKEVKDIDHPVVVHIVTEKGHGFKLATENKEIFHWVCPDILDKDGNLNISDDSSEDYYSITCDYISKKIKKDKMAILVNAATPGAFGFDKEFRESLGKQYVDVGIAEEHAVGFCSALAKNGAKPIFAVMSSFIQRAYDQLSQDLSINNAPVTILVYAAEISSMDCTHLGTFDIPLMSNIPNLVYLAPTNKEEYLAMLDWSVNQTKHSVAIRIPSKEFISTGVNDKTDYSILNKSKVTHKGSKVAIFGLGNFYALAQEVKEELQKQFNIDSTLINPVYITGLDKDLLEDLKRNHDIVITLEDGVIDGGYGEKVARFYGNSDIKVLCYGANKEFTDRVPLDELYKKYRLEKELIAEDIKKLL